MKDEPKVNKAIALLFMEQCIGTHSGHMADIANNQVLMSICMASGVSIGDDASFREFLRQVVNQLDEHKTK